MFKRAFSKSARRRPFNLRAACVVSTALACTYYIADARVAVQEDARRAGFGLGSTLRLALASPRERYKVSIHAARGPRPTMEDRWFVSDDTRFFAVYDGHGGHRVAEQAQKQLYDEFTQSLEELGSQDEDSASSTSTSSSDATIEEKSGTEISSADNPVLVGKALQKGVDQVSRKVLSTTYLDLEGSTAVIVYLCEKMIVTANLGDSRAILCRGSKAIQLTEDHKPDSPQEKKRIEALGGRVKWHGYLGPDKLPVPGMGAYRINGNLAVSRALGDRLERPYVSSEAEVATFPRNSEEDRFIVIASDGLWDVMTSQDVVDFTKQILTGSPSAAAGRPHGNRSKKGASTPTPAVVPMDLPTSVLQQGGAAPQGPPSSVKSTDALIRMEMDKRKARMAQFIVEEALRRGMRRIDSQMVTDQFDNEQKSAPFAQARYFGFEILVLHSSLGAPVLRNDVSWDRT